MRVILFISFIFFLSELLLILIKRSKTKNVKIKKDRGSLILLWIAITLGLSFGFIRAKYSEWETINYFFALTGIIVFILGSILRWSSIGQLKQGFTVNVSINKEHILKTDGIYKYIRHPSYLGLIMVIGGLSVAMNSVISFIITVIPVLVAVNYRIFIEEKLLISEFGEKYIQYKSTTKKLIPGINGICDLFKSTKLT